MLSDHIKSEHKPISIHCDYCGHKADSISSLDTHIEGYHRIKKSGNSANVQELKNKTPCDFKSPQHSSSCCDRDQGKPMRIFTPQERLENGACRNWNEDICRFSDLCRFAHIEICRFQERCRDPEKCRFFHFNLSNAPFLGGSSYRRSFKLNNRDFPPLQAKNQQKRQ